MLGLTYNKKNPSYYIEENLYQFYGYKLAELRLKNNITKRDLSSLLNISEKTLRSLETGQLNNPFYYYNIYCRHFGFKAYNYLDFSLIKTDTLNGKVIFLKAYYGVKSNKELDLILRFYKGAITDYLNHKSKNINIESSIIESVYIIKNKKD
ncbi:hypothetical protein JCM1393_25640 [Clostridium carnis]